MANAKRPGERTTRILPATMHRHKLQATNPATMRRTLTTALISCLSHMTTINRFMPLAIWFSAPGLGGMSDGVSKIPNYDYCNQVCTQNSTVTHSHSRSRDFQSSSLDRRGLHCPTPHQDWYCRMVGGESEAKSQLIVASV